MTKTNKEIESEVIGLISRACSLPAEKIVASSMIADLSADSIQLFQLLLAFEKEYNIEANYEDVLMLETVGDIIAYVEKVVYKSAK